MRALLLSAFLAAAWPLLAYADDLDVPKQSIVGADNPIPLGELADLTLSALGKTPKDMVSYSATWKIIDLRTGLEKRVRADGHGVYFSSGLQNTKLKAICAVTYLYVIKGPDGKMSGASSRTVVLIKDVVIGDDTPTPPGPGPGPGPKPPVPPVPPAPLPDGKYKLAKYVYDAAMTKVPEKTRAKGCAAMADATRGVAAAIAAGTVVSVEDALKKVHDANAAALKDSVGSVADFQALAQDLQEHLFALYKDGKLVALRDFGAAFNEIADGLAAVK